MMFGSIALCVDEATCRNPQMVGLDGESLESQAWLSLFLTGEEARRAIVEDEGIREAWVVASEDVEPINLAATLKADRPGLCVRLVEFDGCGSLFSRAHTAMIDEVVDKSAFLRHYAQAKARFAEECHGVSADGGETVVEDGSKAIAPPSQAEAEQQDQVPQHAPAEQQASTLQQSSAKQQDQAPQHAPAEQPASTSQCALSMQTAPATAPVKAGGHAFFMPIVSGSGGAGKSTVAVMGALIARQMGFRTLLLDYDLQFGDAAIMAGVADALTIDEAMGHPDKLERELQGGKDLVVLAAPERLEAAEGIVHGMPDLLQALSPSFDVIVANTGAAWAEQHAVLLERSSAALFLVDQRASSVRACKHALDLCARCGIASGPFQFAVNRCAKNAPLTSIDVSCALQGASVFELRDGGRDVEDYLSGGAAADLLDSGNEFCASLRHVMGRLLPAQVQRRAPVASVSDDARASRRRGRHAGRKWKRGA